MEAVAVQAILETEYSRLQQDIAWWSIFGKDEVTSSNLVSSSKISLKLVGFGEIFLVLVTFLAS